MTWSDERGCQLVTGGLWGCPWVMGDQYLGCWIITPMSHLKKKKFVANPRDGCVGAWAETRKTRLKNFDRWQGRVSIRGRGKEWAIPLRLQVEFFFSCSYLTTNWTLQSESILTGYWDLTQWDEMKKKIASRFKGMVSRVDINQQLIVERSERKKNCIIKVAFPTFLFFNSSSLNPQLATLVHRQICTTSTSPLYHNYSTNTLPQWLKALRSSDSWTWSPVSLHIHSIYHKCLPFAIVKIYNVSVHPNSHKHVTNHTYLSAILFIIFGAALQLDHILHGMT